MTGDGGATPRWSDNPTLPDDAPTPRTPWRRWGLSVLVALPIAATFGAAVMVLGRALFLDAAREADLAATFDDMPPATLLWLLATATSLIAIVFVMREILETRVARRTGLPPAGITRSARAGSPAWAIPMLLAGSPAVAIVLAAAIVRITTLVSSAEPSGRDALAFATLSGGLLILALIVGWIATMAPREDGREPHVDEGVERTWMHQATVRAFWDVMIFAGGWAIVGEITGAMPSGTTVLVAVILFAQLDFAARMWLIKRREERA